MYLSLLRRIADGQKLKPSDWKIVEKQLESFLTRIESAEKLEEFFTLFPEAKTRIDAQPKEYLDCAFNGSNCVLYDYLTQHLPADFNPWEHIQTQKYRPVLNAILAGNEALINHLVPHMREEDFKQMAALEEKAFTRFQSPLMLDRLPAERLSAVATATLALVRNMPEKYRTALLCRYHFTLLNAPILNNDTVAFQQFIDLLPKGAVQNLIQDYFFAIGHGVMGSRQSGSYDIVDIIANKIGMEPFVRAKLYDKSRDLSKLPAEHKPLRDSPLGELMLGASRIPYPAENLQKILARLPQEMVDQYLSLDDFYPLRNAMLEALDDRFRVFYNALSAEKRLELFENVPVTQTAKMLACLEDDEIYHSLQDILPASYIKFFTGKRPTLVNPADEGKVREAHAKHLGRRKERREEYQPEELTRLMQHAAFHRSLYDELLPLVNTARSIERWGDTGETAAAKLGVLFEDRGQVEKYLDRMVAGYGGEYVQWMHDAVLFDIPQGDFNVPHWRKAVTDFGPAASRFLGRADKIEAYAAQHGLPLPSKPKDIAAIAQHVTYTRGSERPHLARACAMHGIPEDKFDRILDLLANQLVLKGRGEETSVVLKTKSIVPDIAIDGADIGLPGFYMRKLDLVAAAEQEIAERSADHQLTEQEMAAILGKMSRCCQSIGDAGEKFTLHGMTSSHSDFYIWTKKMPDDSERLIAQSWAWMRNAPRSITFDSIEPLGNAYNHIFAPFMEEFARRAQEHHGVKMVTIGKGGKTPKDLPFDTAPIPLRLNGFSFHDTGAEHDSSEQWIVEVNKDRLPSTPRQKP